jgi:hypothetical protein
MIQTVHSYDFAPGACSKSVLLFLTVYPSTQIHLSHDRVRQPGNLISNYEEVQGSIQTSPFLILQLAQKKW